MNVRYPMTFVACAAAAVSLPIAPTMAQEAAEAPACELHVFPTVEGSAQSSGLLSGFGAIGGLIDAASHQDSNRSQADILKEALGPEMQVEALQAVDLPEILSFPPSEVVYETPIADRDVTTKAKTRLTTSSAPCYAELIVTQNLYQKKAIYGRSLSNRFIFKDFRMGLDKAKLVKGRGGNGLSHFPPKTPEENAAAESELREVFVENLGEFARGVKPAS